MISVRKAEQRGHANHGWLDTNHTFSFGGYYDPEHMGFRSLRVINEDKVAAARGFGEHPHQNMEIISYVLSGELEHKDSMGNGSVIRAGEFQRISAGKGVTHSEFNPSSENATHFYQIWITPEELSIEPSYDQKSFPADSPLALVASKDGSNGSMQINQDAKLFQGRLAAGESLALPLEENRFGWLQVIRGEVRIEGETLHGSDGASLSDAINPTISATSDAEFLWFDLS